MLSSLELQPSLWNLGMLWNFALFRGISRQFLGKSSIVDGGRIVWKNYFHLNPHFNISFNNLTFSFKHSPKTDDDIF